MRGDPASRYRDDDPYWRDGGDPRRFADRPTAPFRRDNSPDAYGFRRTAPLRRTPRRTLLWIALGLAAALIVGAGGVFALGMLGAPLAASQTPTTASTATAQSPTVGPTGTTLDGTTLDGPTPSSSPAATVIGTSGPIPPIHLGCAAASLHPYSYVVRNATSAHEIALTFDDGPSPDYTATMMSTLEQTHTLATFFVVGSNADKYPALIKRAAADGFGIGMHTYYHPYMTQLSPADRAWEIAETADAIHRALGPNYCLPYWRPPFDDWNGAVFSQMSAAGLTTITWDNDPADWSSPGVQTIVDRIVAAIHGGGIILCHDGYQFRWQTAQALPQIITKLKAMGYVFVTIPQLLGLPQPYALPDGTSTPTPPPAASPTPTPSPSPSPTPTDPATATPTALRPTWVT